MSADHETDGAPPSEAPKKPLPARVERALAAARAAAKADGERRSGRWLAAVPVAMAVLPMLLLMPRSAVPETPPLPIVDGRVLRAVEQADDARAAAAEAERLPTYVLAVGTALRELNALEVRGGDEVQKIDARRRLDSAVRDLPVGKPDVVPALLSLRALQTRRFLEAVAHWEATGESTDDLVELGGGFVKSIEDAGWTAGRHVLLDGPQRRVAFKVVWNTLVGLDKRSEFTLGLDEQRVLYAFYIEHPHPPEAYRVSLALDRRNATTPEECARAAAEESRQAGLWLAEKLKKLGALDSTYPTEFALGVAYYRAGHFDRSAEAFTTFLSAHPDGAYALRAKNHLKAALAANAAY